MKISIIVEYFLELSFKQVDGDVQGQGYLRHLQLLSALKISKQKGISVISVDIGFWKTTHRKSFEKLFFHFFQGITCTRARVISTFAPLSATCPQPPFTLAGNRSNLSFLHMGIGLTESGSWARLSPTRFHKCYIYQF